MKNCNDNIWNQTREIPASGAVTQPTKPPRTLIVGTVSTNTGQYWGRIHQDTDTNTYSKQIVSSPQHPTSSITSTAVKILGGQCTEHKMYERVGALATMKYGDYSLLVHEGV